MHGITFCSSKDDKEFSIVRECIRRKLEVNVETTLVGRVGNYYLCTHSYLPNTNANANAYV